MVTVVIPTVNRPAMLRQALQSVAAQTARERIGTVLVSENGGGAESRQVCAEFPELPIQYVFRNPAVGPLEHGRILLTESLSDDYVAILHDDDWWLPGHLTNCLDRLKAHPDASACYSSFLDVTVEQGKISASGWHFIWWIGANYPRLEPVWKLGFAEVAAGTFVSVLGHYSALVARRPALESAYEAVVASGNDFDNDRMLPLLLAKHGSVLYLPIPDIVVRAHGQQHSVVQKERINACLTRTTDWLYEQCRAEGIDLNELVAERLRNCPAEARLRLYECVCVPWCIEHGRKLLAANPALASVAPFAWTLPAEPARFTRLKQGVKEFIPPVAWRLREKLKPRLR